MKIFVPYSGVLTADALEQQCTHFAFRCAYNDLLFMVDGKSYSADSAMLDSINPWLIPACTHYVETRKEMYQFVVASLQLWRNGLGPRFGFQGDNARPWYVSAVTSVGDFDEDDKLELTSRVVQTGFEQDVPVIKAYQDYYRQSFTTDELDAHYPDWRLRLCIAKLLGLQSRDCADYVFLDAIDPKMAEIIKLLYLVYPTFREMFYGARTFYSSNQEHIAAFEAMVNNTLPRQTELVLPADLEAAS